LKTYTSQHNPTAQQRNVFYSKSDLIKQLSLY